MLRTILLSLAGLLVLTTGATAQSTTFDEMVRQAHSRARIWGQGPDIRFMGDYARELFAGQASWPAVPGPSGGVVRDGELIHLGVSAPIAHEPCRMLTNAPLAFGNGGMLVWLCPPDNALSYATVTFEYAARDPDTIVRELFADEQRGQGVSAPRCRRVEAPAGLRRMQRCESTFPHGASEGHLLAYVGGREDFFVRIMTACVGTQCDAALPQFEALATALSFDQ